MNILNDFNDYNSTPTSASLNSLFNMRELQSALKMSKNTSPGRDNIPIQLIRNLPNIGLEYLLQIYNYIWTSHTFSTIWKQAIVIPLAKPNKDNMSPNNYRPISLTCNLCKLLEKMINRRLKWVLESNYWNTPNQFGFRRFRSTIDHLNHIHTVTNVSLEVCHRCPHIIKHHNRTGKRARCSLKRARPRTRKLSRPLNVARK